MSAPDMNQFFVHDDVETLSLFVSKSLTVSDLQDRLQSLADRFLRDACRSSNENPWTELLASVRSLGFNVQEGHFDVSSPPVPSASTPLPVAFEESVGGKKHLQATAALLGVSEHTAVSLTVGALRSLLTTRSGEKHFQSLLGTRALVLKVMEYYGKQRIARLEVLGECLRVEQDEDSPYRKVVIPILDSLDKQTVKTRGLFRFILSFAAQKEASFTREQLEKAHQLEATAMSPAENDSKWRQFRSDFLQIKRMLAQREQSEALEAMIGLLYKRIEGGVGRTELALILTAFASCSNFYTKSSAVYLKNTRPPMLAALICVECMTLWRILDADLSSPTDHPLLVGANVFSELRALASILRDLVWQASTTALHRKGLAKDPRYAGVMEIPEGLAGLAFGSLLRFATTNGHDETSTKLGDLGSDLINLTNTQCDVFGYLHAIMSSLIEKMPGKVINPRKQESAQLELTASSLIYASIGRELLDTFITLFKDSLSSNQNSETIFLLCSLAAASTRNSPILCEQFWAGYGAAENDSQPSAFCFLMDAAYTLAVSAMTNTNTSGETFLSAVAPLVHIVSSFSHTPQIVETALTDIFPEGMLLRGLVAAALPSSANEFKKSRQCLLESICVFSQVASSVSSKMKLRHVLEGDLQHSGPRVLLQIAAESRDAITAKACLLTVSNLLRHDAPQAWVLGVAGSIKWMQVSNNNMWHALVSISDGCAREATKLVNQLIVSFSTLAFAMEEVKVAELMKISESALATLLGLLPSFISTVTTKAGIRSQLSYETAAAIMEFCGDALQFTGPIAKLHSSARVRSVACEYRANLVSKLMTTPRLGEAIMYYAVAPVSLDLTQLIRQGLQEANVLHTASLDDNGSARANFFQKLRSQSNFSDGASSEDSVVAVLLSSLEDLDISFDFNELLDHGGFSEEDDSLSPLRAANSSLKLLRRWAHFVECSPQDGGDLSTATFSIASSSPFRLLAAPASLPPPSDVSMDVVYVWKKAKLTNLTLFSRYLSIIGMGALGATLSSLAVDFLSTSFSHGKVSLSEAAGGSFFQAVNRSVSLRSAMKKRVEQTFSFVESASEGDEEGDACLDLGLSCLHILSDCVEVSLAVVDWASDTDILSQLMRTFKVVANALETKKPWDTSVLLEGKGRLRVACGCLNAMVRLLKASKKEIEKENEAAAVGRIASAFDEESSLLPQLLSVIAVCPPTSISMTKECLESLIALLDIIRLSLDAVTVELDSVIQNNSDLSKKTLLARSLEGAFEEDLCGLVALGKNFAIFPSFSVVERVYKEFCDRIGVNNEAEIPSVRGLLETFESSTKKIRIGQSREPDAEFVDLWVSSRSPLNAAEDPFESFQSLSLSYLRLKMEIERIGGWKSFMVVLSRLEAQEWRGTDKHNQLHSLATVEAALVSAKDNLLDFESLMTPFIFGEEIREVVVALSCLPLHFISSIDLSSPFDLNSCVTSLDAVAACCRKLLQPIFQLQNTSVCLEQLLGTAAVLLAQPTPEISTGERSVHIALGGITCTVIRTSKKTSSETRRDGNYWSLLSVCATVLASLVARESGSRDATSWRGEAGYTDQLYEIFSSNDVLKALVLQLTSSMENRTTSAASSEVSKRNADGIRLLVFAFFGKLANTEDERMLSLLANSDISLILPKKSKFSAFAEPSLPMRGYVHKTAWDPTVEEDKEHSVWRASMKFIATALRSTAGIVNDDVKNKFFAAALDFLSVNNDSILLCLEQCSSISFESNRPVLTLNVLREAGLILSITSELCAKGTIDKFKRHNPVLLESLLRRTNAIMSSLSSFLGASGSSRELFRAIDELEGADTMALDSLPHLAALGPMYYVLANGGRNGSFEAMRYSSYASHCALAMTALEKGAQKMYPTRWNPESVDERLSIFERTCRAGVANKFSFQIEYEAAQVLFFGLSVLCRTHPTTSSFVGFTTEEAARLDAMRLVRPGMTIAFRVNNNFARTLLLGDGNDMSLDNNEQVYFARVVSCDTVTRRWEVFLMDGEIPVTTYVNEAQLAGIEDNTRRRGVLRFNSAPQSRVDLQNIGDTPSVGHVILALRWCSQFLVECRDPVASSAGDSSKQVAVRLAELATIFLATELSIYRESANSHSPDSAVWQTVVLQLLDLIGDESEFGELLGDTDLLPLQRRGRIASIVPEELWQRVRVQLREELLSAVELLKRVRSRHRSFDDTGGAVLRSTLLL